MYTRCVTEKTDQQQQLFEQTFLQMLLESHYDDITISELCRRTGLTRKMFYRLFETKSDVLYSLIDRTLMESDSYVPDESVGPGELHQFLAFWQYKKDLLDALQKHQNSSLLTDRAIRFAMLETGSPVRTFGADEIKGSYESIVFYMTGMFSLLLLWHAQGFPSTIDEMSTVMMDLLTTPAFREPPR